MIAFVYDIIYLISLSLIPTLWAVSHAYEDEDTFADKEDGEEKDFLQLFSFLCMLILDVYVKKLLIEKL